MSESRKVRVSDYIADYLENQGVTRAYLLSGGGMMHLLDAFSRKRELKYICNHHEQASAMAAEAYARRSGSLGVCLATSGPGATNTLTGLVGAWQDSSPVLFLTGQSKLSQTIEHTGLHGLRQYGTFEVNIVPIVKSVSKYAVFLDDAKLIRYHLEKACAIARSGRPGPVLIDIPVDLQGVLIEPDTLQGYLGTAEALELTLPECPDNAIENVLNRLKDANRPLLLAGHGVRASGSADLFASVIRKLNIPVATTSLAIDLLEYESDLLVGHPGMKGDRPGNFAVQSADVILSLGCSFHVLTTGYELDQFAPQAYKIQVEPDELVLKREKVGVNEKLHCGVYEFLRKLDQRLDAELPTGGSWIREGAWHRHCQTLKKKLSVSNEPHRHTDDQINYYDLNEALSDLCTGGDTILADAGSAFYVIGQAFRVKKGQRVIISGAMGTMGFALPATTGAAGADPAGRIICVTGDGSLQTNIHELAAIRHNNLNAKIFIVNNDGYVSIRNTQNNFFKGHLAGTSQESGVLMPSLAKIAEAYGIPYLSVKSRTALNEVVGKALATPGPVICEVFAQREQEIIPTVSSVKLEDGSMKSKPLHDMYPFLEEAVLQRHLTVSE